MIDFFEINITDIEKSGYRKFVVKRLDDKLKKKIKQNDDEIDELFNLKIKKFQDVKSFLYSFATFGFFFALFLLVITVSQMDKEINLVNVFIIIGLVVLIVIALILCLVFSKVVRKRLQGSDFKKLSKKSEEYEKMAYKELGIQEGTEKMDIFVRHIAYKGDKVVNALKGASYHNNGLYVYKENNKIYFSDLYELIKIDESAIVDVKYIEERISFISWNKKELHNDKKFSLYEIKLVNQSSYLIKGFYEISLKIKEKEYLIRIPGYEKEQVENIFIRRSEVDDNK